jgi:hypothetical protein
MLLAAIAAIPMSFAYAHQYNWFSALILTLEEKGVALAINIFLVELF